MKDTAYDALHASILSTLALAEAESCPALSYDIITSYLHTDEQIDASSLERACAYLADNHLIRYERDRYALASHGYAFHAIEDRHAAAQKKLECNRIPLLLLQTIPFARAMAVTGSISLNNASEKSDVDIFCLAERGRLWTARALSLGLAALFFRRRDDTISGEKLCFNYFLAHDAQAPVQNIASAHMLARAIPLFDRDAFVRFFTANSWIGEHLRYPQKQAHFRRMRVLHAISRAISFLLSGSFGDRVEQRLKAWQMRRLARKVREGSDLSHLILRDDAILLHYPRSKNRAVMNHYTYRMRELGITPRD